MAKYLTEAIGTFFLVLTIGFSVTGGAAMAPLAIGAALMVMVYMGGHVSGGHYNPAVSLGAMMRGALDGAELLPYWVAQVVGAIAAACTVNWVVGTTFAPGPGAGYGTFEMLVVEFLYTFALVLVVLNVATSKKTEGNSYYGLAIGFTVGAGAFAVGPISGAAFNPAVAIGAITIDTFLGDGGLGALWIYLVSTLAGGAAAAMVFNLQEGAGG